MFDACHDVGGKYSFPSTQECAASSAIAGAAWDEALAAIEAATVELHGAWVGRDAMRFAPDVRTALDWLDSELHLPLIFAGFSFGAAVGLRAACADPRVRATIGLGVPVAPVAADTEEPRVYTYEFLQTCNKPKLFVSGARDQFGPRAKLEALVASLPDPKKLVLIEGGDHFFEGRLREMRETIESWVKETLG